MSLQETRARSAALAVQVAERLRENARADRPLPIEARRDVFDLLRRGYAHLAALALDTYLSDQEAAHV